MMKRSLSKLNVQIRKPTHKIVLPACMTEAFNRLIISFYPDHEGNANELNTYHSLFDLRNTTYLKN